jgi:hypothetical protein
MRPTKYVCSRRRESVAAGLLGLRVRFPLGYGSLSPVNVVCCQVKFSVTGQSLFRRSPSECVCVCVCVCMSLIVIKGNNILYIYNEQVYRDQE